MPSFNYVINEVKLHTGSNSEDTASTTPALGDIFICAGYFSLGTGAALSGGGMTWTQRLLHANDQTDDIFVAVFEATAGTPSEGVLTFTASDSFVDLGYVLIRGVDLTYFGIAGNDSSDDEVASLTISLTTTDPGGLVTYFYTHNLSAPAWAEDAGWTEQIDENNTNDASHQVMERFSDDTEVIGDAAVDARIIGVCLEFAAVGGGPSLTYVPYRRYF